MNNEKFALLVVRYLQGTASDEDRRELAASVSEDSELQKVFLEQARLNVRLNAALGTDSEAKARTRARLILASVSEEKSRETVRIVTDRVNGTGAPRRRWGAWWVAAAACLAVIVGSLGYNEYRRRTFADTLVAHIESASKNVVIQRDGRTVIAMVGMEIILGDRIETGGQANVKVSYDGEATDVNVGGNTTLIVGGGDGASAGMGKRLFLELGAIEVTVAPQPEGRPMVVGTPHSTAEVKSTVFKLVSGETSARVEVRKGLVTYTRKSDGKAVSVGSGRDATAGAGIAFEVKDLPALPEIVPVSPDEKARLLAAESEEQKKLRAELVLLGMKGQRIVFSSNADGVHRVYTMHPDGSNVRCLTPSPGRGGKYVRVSPDGTMVAFRQQVPRKELEKAALTEDPALKRESLRPEIDPVSGEEWLYALCVMDMDDTASLRRLAVGGWAPHWHPDGKKIVYHVSPLQPRYKVAVFDFEKNRERLAIPPERGTFFPFYTPDGRYLVTGGARFLFEVGSDGLPGADMRRFKGSNLVGGFGEISRDGKWFVWVEDTDSDLGGWLWYASFVAPPAPPGKRTRLPLGWERGSANYHPGFSPDAQYLVYAHGDQQKGVRAAALEKKLEFYVTRFPACDVTVRITWNGAGNYDPHWRGSE